MGTKVPGVDVKFLNGEEGEILIRSHMLVDRYLQSNHATPYFLVLEVVNGELIVPLRLDRYFGNDEATREAQDEEGYFKTGDIVVKKGDYYFVLGGALIDSKSS